MGEGYRKIFGLCFLGIRNVYFSKITTLQQDADLLEFIVESDVFFANFENKGKIVLHASNGSQLHEVPFIYLLISV